MTESKNNTESATPGPWTWDFPDYGPHQAREQGKHRRSGEHFSLGHDLENGRGLCVLCSAPYGNLDGDAHRPSEADACLIAAAPDLLSVAKDTLEYWELTGFAKCAPDCDCIVDTMRKVIAKAEGSAS